MSAGTRVESCGVDRGRTVPSWPAISEGGRFVSGSSCIATPSSQRATHLAAVEPFYN